MRLDKSCSRELIGSWEKSLAGSNPVPGTGANSMLRREKRRGGVFNYLSLMKHYLLLYKIYMKGTYAI